MYEIPHITPAKKKPIPTTTPYPTETGRIETMVIVANRVVVEKRKRESQRDMMKYCILKIPQYLHADCRLQIAAR